MGLVLPRAVAAILLAAVVLGPAGVAHAASAEQQLADHYAPIVALKQQDAACDTKGEAYERWFKEIAAGALGL